MHKLPGVNKGVCLPVGSREPTETWEVTDISALVLVFGSK